MFLILIFPLFSEGRREITIEYTHSLRIPYNKIRIQFITFSENNEKHQIWIETKQMEGRTGFEYSNTSNFKDISKEYFDTIYEKLLNINYNEIIEKNINNTILGTDGTSIMLKIGNDKNNIILNLWSIDYNAKNRKTEELNIIIKELFSYIGLGEWY
jgi:Ran GTPase-activating protein (RanGAP) involved in mRNA processing and transport